MVSLSGPGGKKNRQKERRLMKGFISKAQQKVNISFFTIRILENWFRFFQAGSRRGSAISVTQSTNFFLVNSFFPFSIWKSHLEVGLDLQDLKTDVGMYRRMSSNSLWGIYYQAIIMTSICNRYKVGRELNIHMVLVSETGWEWVPRACWVIHICIVLHGQAKGHARQCLQKVD